jgi:hypothetical protein
MLAHLAGQATIGDANWLFLVRAVVRSINETSQLKEVEHRAQAHCDTAQNNSKPETAFRAAAMGPPDKFTSK